MAALSGTAGSVVLVAGGTAVVGEIAEWTLNFAMQTPETTAFGDNWQEFLAGVRGATGTFRGNFDPADGPQGTVTAYMMAGSAVALRLYASSTKYFNVGTALVQGMSPGISQTGKGDIGFDFTASGAVTLV